MSPGSKHEPFDWAFVLLIVLIAAITMILGAAIAHYVHHQ
jgi:hypothetical protein